MVTSEDILLDEVILQVFEEQDDAFHFPVTSQKEARAFVKALNTKGLSYICLSQEIKELEQNFSAWRTGISRPGIGNRVIERINRPLQEVLLSDGDDDSASCDQLSACSDDTAGSIDSIHNGVHSSDGKELRLVAGAKSEVHLTSNIKNAQNLDNLSKPKESDDLKSTTINTQRKVNGKHGSNEEISALQDQGEGESKSTVEESQQVKEISDVVANGSDDCTVTKSSDIASQQKASILSENADSVAKACTTKTDQDLETVDTKELDKESVVKEIANSEKLSAHEELKERDSCESLHRDTKDTEHDLTHANANSVNHKNIVSQDKSASEDILLPDKDAVVAGISEAESSCSLDKVSTIDVKSPDNLKPDPEFIEVHSLTGNEEKSGNIVEEKFENVQDNHSVSVSESIGVENNSEAEVTRDSEVVHTVEKPETFDNSEAATSTGTTDQVGDVDTEITIKSMPLSCEATTPSKTSVDVFENYDSDCDEELDDDIKGLASTGKENDKGNDPDEKFSSRDSGYIYVFTDTLSEGEEFRVKIGASRYPHKKLKQALHFNIDMKLVSAVKVCHRPNAIASVQRQLSEFAIQDTAGWFRGPLDKILQAHMIAASEYPVQD